MELKFATFWFLLVNFMGMHKHDHHQPHHPKKHMKVYSQENVLHVRNSQELLVMMQRTRMFILQQNMQTKGIILLHIYFLCYHFSLQDLLVTQSFALSIGVRCLSLFWMNVRKKRMTNGKTINSPYSHYAMKL